MLLSRGGGGGGGEFPLIQTIGIASYGSARGKGGGDERGWNSPTTACCGRLSGELVNCVYTMSQFQEPSQETDD